MQIMKKKKATGVMKKAEFGMQHSKTLSENIKKNIGTLKNDSIVLHMLND